MHALTRRLLLAPAVVLLAVSLATPAHADSSGTTSNGDSATTYANEDGSPGSASPSSGAQGAECLSDGRPVDCVTSMGTWSNLRQCYVTLTSPQPPQSDPVWEGHTDGAIYNCRTTIGDSLLYNLYFFWSATGPATSEQLALRAVKTIQLPSPVMRRSPPESNSHNGTPYTWVGLWTWFWTDPNTWQTLSARATAGSVWAEATVTPRVLVITPGNGDAVVRCAGPGREWTEADGNDAPSNGGCGYKYRHVTDGTLTATVTIEWAVTWTGSGGAGGTLPVMRTSTTSDFAVMQIQIVTQR